MAPDYQGYLTDAAVIATIVYTSVSVSKSRRTLKESRDEDRGEDQRFLDTLKGVHASPGVEAKPSLVERLSSVEDGQKVLDRKTDGQNKVLEKILSQLIETATLVARIDELTAMTTKLSNAFIEHLQHPTAGSQPVSKRAPTRSRTPKQS